MSGWTVKRFWQDAAVVPQDGGFGISLDGRLVKTPAKAPLTVPTPALAEAIAQEWNAQAEQVRPLTMPFTRSSNAAIDKVSQQFDEVAALIAAYGETDLLCYRAAAPDDLVARQSQAWDPLLGWSRDVLKAPLTATTGIVHQSQPADSIAVLQGHVRALDPFALTALHDLVALSGSLVIGLAALAGYAPPQDLWRASRIDEDWQQEVWGADEDAAQMAELKRRDFMHAHRFAELSNAMTGPSN